MVIDARVTQRRALMARGSTPGRWTTVSLSLLMLFVQSYALERLLFGGAVDLTYTLGALAGGMALVPVLQRGRLRAAGPTDFAVLVFSGVLLLSAAVNGSGLGFPVRVLLASILPYFLARLYVLDDAAVARVVATVALAVAVTYAVASLIDALWISPDAGQIRPGGANPIATAEIVGFGTVTAFIQTIRHRRRLRWAYLVGGGVCLAAQIVALGSRGSVAAVFVTLLLVVTLTPRIRRAGFKLLLVGALIGIGLVMSESGVADRFRVESMVADPSLVGSERFVGRAQLWTESFDTIAEHPILGAGPGAVYSHNLLLEVGSGMGLLGLAALILLLVSVPWRRLLMAIRKNDAVLLVVSLFLFTLIYRQSSFALDSHKSLFTFLGLLVGMGRRASDHSVDERGA